MKDASRQLALASLALVAACHRSAPEEPIPSSSSTAADAGGPTPDAAAMLPPGLVHPHSPVPPIPDGAVLPPTPTHLPDWALDANDPARDYVRRYIRSVVRYGDATMCVEPQPSVDNGGTFSVHVVDGPPSRGCLQPPGVDETFVVDLSADRLSLPTPQADRPQLHKWNDGSDPAGPAKTPVPELTKAHEWKSPVAQLFRDHRLAMIRVQFYGRGTYPVVTIAGWTPTIGPTSPQATLDAFAQEICANSHGLPLAVFGGLDRSKELRVRCGKPDQAVWDTL